ncbi:NAD(P)(+) transhydrogenase (Re/Si-specific) subunit alpha, partial [Kitasatospora phosalacinea]
MSGYDSSARPPQRVGVVAESTPGETRVAATPATVRGLLALGYDVVRGAPGRRRRGGRRPPRRRGGGAGPARWK